MIFGKDASIQAEKISNVMFGNPLEVLATMTTEEISALANEVGSVQLNENSARILELLVESGLAPSNGEAKKLIASGSIFFNEQKITDIQQEIKKSDLIHNI